MQKFYTYKIVSKGSLNPNDYNGVPVNFTSGDWLWILQAAKQEIRLGNYVKIDKEEIFYAQKV